MPAACRAMETDRRDGPVRDLLPRGCDLPARRAVLFGVLWRPRHHARDPGGRQWLVGDYPRAVSSVYRAAGADIPKASGSVIATILIGGFAFIAGFSIGLFYLPAAVMMLLATCVRPSARSATRVREPPDRLHVPRAMRVIAEPGMEPGGPSRPAGYRWNID